MAQQRELQIKFIPPVMSEKESDKTIFALFDLLLKKEPENNGIDVVPITKKQDEEKT